MTAHDLYPSWIKFRYTSNGRTKHAIYPCSIESDPIPGIEPDLLTRGSGNVAATACMAAWCAAINDSFNTSDSFDSYEVYHKGTVDGPTVFLYGAALGLPGINPTADQAYVEAVWTFKTPESGGLKIYLMETILGADQKIPLPVPANPVVNNINAFVMSDDNFIIGRNNNMPLLPLFCTTKQNDFYRRKYKL